MRQEVVTDRTPADVLWQTALSMGMEELIRGWRRDENKLLGRVVEWLGHTMVRGMYPPPDYIVTHSGLTSSLINLFSEQDWKRWFPSVPDGFVLQDKEEGCLRLLAFMECKVSHHLNLDHNREQFDGFDRLISLLTEHGSARGKVLLSQLLHREIGALEIDKNFRYLYVVPSDRSSGGIATSMYGEDHLTELQLPFSTWEVQKRIRAVQDL